MNMNDLEDAVLEHFNYDTEAADSAPRRRIRRAINSWHHRILTTPGLQGLRDGTLTFASVASTAKYTFPNAVAKVHRVYELTNDLTLTGRGMDWYRNIEPDPNTGIPSVFAPGGYAATATAVSATELGVKSSSASDTTGQVKLEYVRSDGTRGTSSVTLNGTTLVDLGITGTAVEVTKFYLTAKKLGAVTLYGNLGTVVHAVIPIGRTYSRYYTLYLWPTPSSVLTYYLDYQREIEEMENGTDEPLLPLDYHYLLELGAKISEYEKREDARRVIAEGHYLEGLRKLVSSVNFPAGAVYVPGEIAALGASRLGPWYPRGT